MNQSGDFQLLPGKQKTGLKFKAPGSNGPLVFAVVVFVLIIAAYFGATFYLRSVEGEINDTNSLITLIQKDRDKELEHKLLAFSTQLEIIDDFLKSHIYWSDAFVKFSNLIQTKVQISDVGMSTSQRNITFNGTADNLKTLAQQVTAFSASPHITKIIIGGITSTVNDDVDFDMEIFFDPDDFLTKNSND